MLTPEQLRTEFARVWTDYKAALLRQRDEQMAMQTQYDGELLALAKATFPKSRSKRLIEKLLTERPDIYKPFIDAWQTKADSIVKEHRAISDGFKEQLNALAESAAVHAGEMRLFTSVWSSTYNSQGFGALKYAKNNAEQYADLARYHDIACDVRLTNERSEPTYGVHHGTYEVRVGVESEIDLEILRRKPGPTLREWVRMCWQRGVNPRVYNPFLPHGYEEQNGLDYHGNDLNEKKAVNA